MHRVVVGLACLLAQVTVLAAADWGSPAEVRFLDQAVVSYRARLAGTILVVEVTHEPGWHTYALDNIARARRESGKDRPDTELPTRIELTEGLEALGPWYQTEPLELSQPAIRWFTWGFDGVSRFAVEVEPSGGAAVVTVNGQACTETRCARIDDLVVQVPIGHRGNATADDRVDLSVLIEVSPPN